MKISDNVVIDAFPENVDGNEAWFVSINDGISDLIVLQAFSERHAYRCRNTLEMAISQNTEATVAGYVPG